MQTQPLSWNDIVKREAKGLDNFSFGEVKAVGMTYVLAEKGAITKSHYYLPKYLVKGFDGKTLWFNVSEKQADMEFKRNAPPSDQDYYKYKTTGATPDTESYVPIVPSPTH